MFLSDAALFQLGRFPCWLSGAYYGFPALPDHPGFKVAKHWRGELTDPNTVDRQQKSSDESLIRDFLRGQIPSANGPMIQMKICMYTHGGSWLGPLAGEPRVTFVVACNGGGFKFSSALGEALADYACDGKTDLPVSFMRLL